MVKVKEISRQEWNKQFDKHLYRRCVLTWKEASGDDYELDQFFEDGLTPAEAAKYFAEDRNLIDLIKNPEFSPINWSEWEKENAVPGGYPTS